LQSHITVEVNDITRGSWNLIGYYRYPNGRLRRARWDFLHHLANRALMYFWGF